MEPYIMGPIDTPPQPPPFTRHPPHYHGDIVRRLFLIAGMILLVAIPLDKGFLNVYLSLGILMVLTLALFAGFTSPTHRFAIIADVVVSGMAFLFFEYLAVTRYIATENFTETTFLLRQLLALTFLVAVYFAAKTLRGIGFPKQSSSKTS